MKICRESSFKDRTEVALATLPTLVLNMLLMLVESFNDMNSVTLGPVSCWSPLMESRFGLYLPPKLFLAILVPVVCSVIASTHLHHTFCKLVISFVLVL